MAGGITIAQAIDLGQATLESFKEDALQYTLKHNTYEIVNRWLASDKMVLDGGDRAEAYIQLKDSTNAAHVRLYDVDTPNVENLDKKITVNWTHAKTSFSYAMQELSINSGNMRRIYNLLLSRKRAAYKALADLLEEAAWRTPAAADDDLNPFGIPAWLCQADADTSTGDFNGYVPDYTVSGDTESGMSTIGGLSCTSAVNARWASWYADHNDNLGDNLLKLLRKAFRKTKFQTPKLAGQAIDPDSAFSNFRLYTNDTVLDNLEELAQKSDDSIGFDLGKYAGNVVFKGIPFVYVDQLDTELTYVYGGNPIFGINHNHFYPIVLSGENFRINPPINSREQNNVFTVFCDLSYAYMCDNRRQAGFMISDWEGGN